MTYPFIPEGLIPLTVGEPRLGNNAIVEWVNISEAEMVWIDCFATVAAAAAVVCTPRKAYAAAGTGTAVLGFNVPIWAGLHAQGAALTLTRQTDAANYTTAATAGIHRVIFQIETSALGWEATVPSLGEYKYMSCTVAGLVADYVSCTFWVKPRYQSDTVASTRWIV
jgi:hypothetical protein